MVTIVGRARNRKGQSRTLRNFLGNLQGSFERNKCVCGANPDPRARKLLMEIK